MRVVASVSAGSAYNAQTGSGGASGAIVHVGGITKTGFGAECRANDGSSNTTSDFAYVAFAE